MPDSAIGFGAADWIEFLLAGLLILSFLVWNPKTQRAFARLAQRRKLVMLGLFTLPIALRLALLPNHPVPVPNIYDEFSHLLVADTLLHGRFANPPHAMPRFFETFFVLQRPSYSSIYPIGQGFILAMGRLVSGIPWTGVLISTGALCALTYWALLGYLSPSWALLGGIFAVIEFGPLSLWMNCYWGGALPAAEGCLVFGALPRLGNAWNGERRARSRDVMLLGVGLGAHFLTRPFETMLLALAALVFCAPFLMRPRLVPSLPRSFAVLLLTMVPFCLTTVLHDKQAAGAWNLLPEALSQFQYGVPTTLTIQNPAMPHVALTREQALEYRSQLLMHGTGTDTWRRFLLRLEYRARDYRFFFLPPLYLAAVAFLFALRRRLFLWVAGTLVLFALGTNLFPYLLVHYLAAVTCLFVLVSVEGIRQISRLRIRGRDSGMDLARIIVLLCCAQFVVWYTVHLFERHGAPLALLQYETWDSINHANGNPRTAVARRLAQIPGHLLVFVHYSPGHIFQDEWVWNAADIDAARVVFARDLGAAEDEKLITYYPDRKVFWLDADAQPPRVLEHEPGVD